MLWLNVFETVTIKNRFIHCKIDTGAFSSSIDKQLSEDLGLNEYTDGKTIFIRTAMGVKERKRVSAYVTFSRTESKHIIFNVEDRADMKFPIIIGRRDLRDTCVMITDEESDPNNPTNVKTLS